MKVSIKRTITIKIKELISKIVLLILYRGFKIVYKYDDTVKEEIDNLKENFTIEIKLYKNGPSLKLIKRKNGLYKVKKEIYNSNIWIIFKSIDSAFLVLTGRQGISRAYAEHRFALKGEISKAMSLVRMIDILEAYLFPKFITQNILKKQPVKKLNLFNTYLSILCDYR